MNVMMIRCLSMRSKPAADSWEPKPLCHFISQFSVSLIEHLDDSLRDVLPHSLHRSDKVENSVILHFGTHHLAEESAWLSEVIVRIAGPDSGYQTCDLVWSIFGVLIESECITAVVPGVWLVIWLRA